MEQQEWKNTLLGLLIVIVLGSLLVGCQEPASKPAPEPVIQPDTDRPSEPASPVNTETNVDPEPAKQPAIVPAKPSWAKDCSKTDNDVINEWKLKREDWPCEELR